MIAAGCIGLVLGVLIGWYFRSARQSSTTRMVDELYGRKVRLAESDREAAVKQLNENRLAMATFDERFAALGAEIEKQRAELAASAAARRALEEDVGRKAREIADVREETERARRFADEVLRESGESAQERERAVAEMERALSELGGRDQEVAELSQRLNEVHDVARTLRGELADRTSAYEEAMLERSAAMGEFDRARVELEAARVEIGRLAAVDDEVVRLRELVARRDETLAEREAAIEAQSRRLNELEPVPERLRETREQLAAAHEVHKAREAELDRSWGARFDSERRTHAVEVSALSARLATLEPFADEVALLRARVAELEPVPQRLASESQRATELAQALERDRTSLREFEARLAELSEQLARAKSDLEETAAGRTRTSERADALAAELDRERGTSRGLEARAAEMRSEIENAARELAANAERLEQSNQRGAALEQKLERSRARIEQLETRVAAQTQDLEDVRRERGDLHKQLAALGASHRAKQLEIERRTAKLADAQRVLAERNDRIRVLVAEQRAARTDSRAKAVSKAAPVRVNGSERDDLTSIAGIGPVIARKLARLGVKTHRQLATLTRDELERLAEKLGLTVERIRREGWIDGAREALRAK